MAAPTPPVRRWSFSALKDFEACPYRTYLAKVQKEPQPEIGDQPDHPLVRGDRIHKEAEAFIRGEGPLTRDLRKQSTRLKELAEGYEEGRVLVEERWCFRQDWSVCDPDDPDIWLMVIADAVEFPNNHTAIIDDWKTGKSMGKEVAHGQQRQLYALAAFMRFAKITHIRSAMRYLDEKPDQKKDTGFSRESIAPLIQRWEQRAKAMTNALVFPAKPNRGNCRFCPFGPSNGTGVCSYGVEA